MEKIHHQEHKWSWNKHFEWLTKKMSLWLFTIGRLSIQCFVQDSPGEGRTNGTTKDDLQDPFFQIGSIGVPHSGIIFQIVWVPWREWHLPIILPSIFNLLGLLVSSDFTFLRQTAKWQSFVWKNIREFEGQGWKELQWFHTKSSKENMPSPPRFLMFLPLSSVGTSH